MFGMLGVFAEFEREMIVARVNAGLARAKSAIARDGRFTSKAGKVRTRLGRPGALPAQIEAARSHLAAGTGIGKTARLTKLGVGTVHQLGQGDARNALSSLRLACTTTRFRARRTPRASLQPWRRASHAPVQHGVPGWLLPLGRRAYATACRSCSASASQSEGYSRA
jgi:hypothetical protein